MRVDPEPDCCWARSGAVTSIEPKSQLRSSMMALSDLIVRQAKTAGKLYNLPDLDGLGLVVSPVGGKSWHFRYYWLGKQKRISLGNYPERCAFACRASSNGSATTCRRPVRPPGRGHQDRGGCRVCQRSWPGGRSDQRVPSSSS